VLLAVPGHPERGAFFLLDPLRQVFSLSVSLSFSPSLNPKTWTFSSLLKSVLIRLVKVVKDYAWEPKSTARLQCYSALLATLSACYQKKLPYEWDKIESNELLWGQTESYLSV
jgi:hypothetical protein